jgi:hypothetical protein
MRRFRLTPSALARRSTDFNNGAGICTVVGMNTLTNIPWIPLRGLLPGTGGSFREPAPRYSGRRKSRVFQTGAHRRRERRRLVGADCRHGLTIRETSR